jgi:hypothetical protein
MKDVELVAIVNLGPLEESLKALGKEIRESGLPPAMIVFDAIDEFLPAPEERDRGAGKANEHLSRFKAGRFSGEDIKVFEGRGG